jgi:hypothetical protein
MRMLRRIVVWCVPRMCTLVYLPPHHTNILSCFSSHQITRESFQMGETGGRVCPISTWLWLITVCDLPSPCTCVCDLCRYMYLAGQYDLPSTCTCARVTHRHLPVDSLLPLLPLDFPPLYYIHYSIVCLSLLLSPMSLSLPPMSP